MRRILFAALLSAALLAAVAPSCACAQETRQPAMAQDLKDVSISVSNATVHVTHADGQRLEVYNMAGVKVATVRIDSPDKTIPLDHLPKGCYILRIGNTARKVYLR